jgi:phosphoesterase RecJ-like protein
LILGHVRPDGDCVGSMVALTLGLRACGKDAQAWSTDAAPTRYAFLEPCITPPRHSRFADFDLLVLLDTATLERAAIDDAAFTCGVPSLIIDHHLPVESNATFACIQQQESAAGCIVHDILCALPTPITAPVAAALYAAILTDTGNFTYQNTTARAFDIARALLETGIDIAAIAAQIYNTVPAMQLHLLAAALATLELTNNGAGAFMYLTKEALQRYDATSLDVEDFVNYPRSLAGVKIAATLTEMPENGQVRISLRSKTSAVNVNPLARAFGGGGHVCASGAVVKEPLQTFLPRFRAALSEYLQQY